MEDPASKYFSCSSQERAIFEAGIKLGSIYHQYTGIPINESNVDLLERAIERAVKVQPFVEKVNIKIDRNKVGKNQSSYKYKTLTGDMLSVSLIINYEGSRVEGGMHYVEEMDYPLMTFRVIK